MFGFYTFPALLLLCCGYAIARGGRDSRLMAATSIAATALTLLLLTPAAHRYAGVEEGVFVVDTLTLVSFVAIALWSDRFWPLWISGLQLTSLMAHVLKTFDYALLPYAYAAAMRFWSYPIVIIIAVGAWRHRQRLARMVSSTA